ncbi:uncharacterized protein EI97DRAFT_431460 [Westerdykella ornata]|uniref:Uncharacterized protein n=1 Tax=Westerdykella ornata TaxID=318751 RepID=A0A6A6JPY1_WESOR|nr:uncharacterized protein EI97DRAFT_431460 [Westerdykella ornata]KAF2278193.1 hypothetical protein EI97DRAFT_431460 [Westerdykella ornata]
MGAPERDGDTTAESEKLATPPPSSEDPPAPTPEMGVEADGDATAESDKVATPSASPEDPPAPIPEVGPSESGEKETAGPETESTPPPPPIDPMEFLCRSATPSLKSTKSSKSSYVRPVPGPISYSVPGDPAEQPAPTKAAEGGQSTSPEATPAAPSEASRKSPAPSVKSHKSSAERSVKDIKSVDAPPPADKSVASNSPANNAPSQAPESIADEPSPSSMPPPTAPSESSRRSTSPSIRSSKSSTAPYVRPIPVPIGSSTSPDPPPPPESIASAAPSKTPTATNPPSPRESAIIPPFHAPSAASTKSSSHTLPTPPRSRAPSPLFPAEDEIEALTRHRSRNQSATAPSRRSGSAPKTSNEELKKETTKRTSGYALSTSKSTTVSTDDKSHRPCSCDRSLSEQSMRSSNSRYMCESRSAAIKGLYPNSPLAGGSVCCSHNSLAGSNSSMPRARSLRRRSERLTERGSWETGFGAQGSMESASERRNSEA